jgi:hypothetical protein
VSKRTGIAFNADDERKVDKQPEGKSFFGKLPQNCFESMKSCCFHFNTFCFLRSESREILRRSFGGLAPIGGEEVENIKKLS